MTRRLLTSHRDTIEALARWLALAALVELILLRTGTRTLIHIPGLGRFDTSIGAFAEVGRFAYYLAVVLVISVLIYVALMLLSGGLSSRTISLLTVSFIALATAGRLGALPGVVIPSLTLVVLVAMALLTWTGIRSIPVVLFVAASAIAGWSVVGQRMGGGIAGNWVDIAIIVAEGLLILAGVTTPLMVAGRTTRSAFLAGVAAFVAAMVGLSVGGSTLSILLLWNLGVPGWLSPVAFAFAFGGVVTAVWSAQRKGEILTAAAIILLIAAGVGTISTYQSALALAAVLLFGVATGAIAMPGRQEPALDADPEMGDILEFTDRTILDTYGGR